MGYHVSKCFIIRYILSLLWVTVLIKMMKDTNINVSSPCYFVETKDEKYLFRLLL